MSGHGTTLSTTGMFQNDLIIPSFFKLPSKAEFPILAYRHSSFLVKPVELETAQAEYAYDKFFSMYALAEASAL